jgi:hypothetical protein
MVIWSAGRVSELFLCNLSQGMLLKSLPYSGAGTVAQMIRQAGCMPLYC